MYQIIAIEHGWKKNSSKRMNEKWYIELQQVSSDKENME